MDLLHPSLSPFIISLMILAGIAVLEVIGLVFGVAFSDLVDAALPDFDTDVDADIDGDLDADGSGFFGGALSWLGLGKIPLLIVLAAFLGSFGVTGIILQNIVHGVIGAYAPALFAALAALIAALPATRILSLGIARIFPKEQSEAVSTDSFIGRMATIIRGEARKGAPAEAKLTDATGAVQYVLVEPDEAATSFAAGETVLLVEKAGAVFRAARHSSPAL